jgi:hypothetical protein
MCHDGQPTDIFLESLNSCSHFSRDFILLTGQEGGGGGIFGHWAKKPNEGNIIKVLEEKKRKEKENY